MIDPIGLKAEITTDPKGLGYAPFVQPGSDNSIMALLNDPTNAKGQGTVAMPSLSKDQFLLATAPMLFTLVGLSAAIQAKWTPILEHLRAADQLDFTSATVQALVTAAVADGLLTQAQATALNQRMGSRAEVLFGAGTVLTNRDISFALRGS
jgi:hypothetical protein